MRARRLHATSLRSAAELPRNDLIAALTPGEARALLYEWAFWARPNQLPPNGEWRVWLVLAGRGFGKTRTGAEMIRARVTARTAHRLALVAPTAGDARDVLQVEWTSVGHSDIYSFVNSNVSDNAKQMGFTSIEFIDGQRRWDYDLARESMVWTAAQ